MKYKEQVFVSVVVYLYNDEYSIENFLNIIYPIIYDTFEHYEFVFVDNGSNDSTWQKLVGTIESLKINSAIIRLSQAHAKEIALLAGNDKAVGDFVYEFESSVIDYSPRNIIEMFEVERSGFDVVALRPKKIKSISKKLFYYFFNKLSPSANVFEERVTLTTRRALNSILSINERLRYRKALSALTGFKKKFILYEPINYDVTDKRSLSVRLSRGLEHLVSYSSIGIKLPMFASLFFIIVSLVIASFAVYAYLFRDDVAGKGWTSIMLFLSVSFGGIFFVLSIVCAYIFKVLKEVINYPHYTVEKIHKFFNTDADVI